MSDNIFFLLILFWVLELAVGLTASSDSLLWRQVNRTIAGISSVEEAFVLVPADYEDAFSPLIPVNIRKFVRNNETSAGGGEGEAVNLWFIPGGPGQSSKTLEVMLPVLVVDLPAGSAVYAVDHRGLGRSTPLASGAEKALLEAFPGDLHLLPQIVSNQQRKLGILTPITRVLRVENVARDLLKGVELVQKERRAGDSRKHFVIGISYGTMVARRALQISAIGTFAGALLDGLAPTEKIEQSNESDRILQEFCEQVEGCAELLRGIEAGGGGDDLKVRGIIPRILQSNSGRRNSCTSYFMTAVPAAGTLCANLHEFMNAVWLSGRASVKVAGLRLMFELIRCGDAEAFRGLFDAVYGSLVLGRAVNQLQSAAAVAGTSGSREKQGSSALTSDALVFEVVSALERYDVTRSTMGICFNRKHSVNGDDPATCPSRLFDPCKFFRTTWERKGALKALSGALPPISIKTPMVVAPGTRIIVLAGNLDFNTPTWLTRQIAAKYTKGPEVNYHEFFGYGHGIYGSSQCNREIFAEFLRGGADRKELTARCVRRWNAKNRRLIDRFFQQPLTLLASLIEAGNY